MEWGRERLFCWSADGRGIRKRGLRLTDGLRTRATNTIKPSPARFLTVWGNSVTNGGVEALISFFFLFSSFFSVARMEGLHGFMPSCKATTQVNSICSRKAYDDGGGLVTSTEGASSVAWHMAFLYLSQYRSLYPSRRLMYLLYMTPGRFSSPTSAAKDKLLRIHIQQ